MREIDFHAEINSGEPSFRMNGEDYKKNIYKEELVKEKFSFFHDFTISNVKIMTKEDLLKCKKTLQEEDEEELSNYESNEF